MTINLCTKHHDSASMLTRLQNFFPLVCDARFGTNPVMPVGLSAAQKVYGSSIFTVNRLLWIFGRCFWPAVGFQSVRELARKSKLL